MKKKLNKETMMTISGVLRDLSIECTKDAFSILTIASMVSLAASCVSIFEKASEHHKK